MRDKFECLGEYCPDCIDSVLDFKTVVGGYSVVEEACGRGISVDDVLYYDCGKFESHVDCESRMVSLYFDFDGEELEFDSVSIEPVVAGDMEDHPLIKGYGNTTDVSVTQESKSKSVDDIGDVGNRYRPLHFILDVWSEKYGSEKEIGWIDALDRFDRCNEVYKEFLIACRDAGLEEVGGIFSVYINGEPPVELEGYVDFVKSMKSEDEAVNNGSDSRGEGVCLVSGREGTVLGSSDVLLFSDYQSSKQIEEQPGLDPARSHEYRPISLESGLLSKAGSSVFSELSYSISIGGESSSDYYELYIVPFFVGEYEFSDIEKAFDELSMYSESDFEYAELLESIVGRLYEPDGDAEDIPFLDDIETEPVFDRFFVSLQDTSGNVDIELDSGVVSKADVERVVDMVNEVSSDVEWWYKGGNSGNKSSLVDGEVSVSTVAKTLLYQRYVSRLCGKGDRVRGSGSVEFDVPLALLTGSNVSYESLVSQFSERVQSTVHDIDVKEPYALYDTVAEQFLLLEVLYRLDRFDKSFKTSDNTDIHMNDDFVDSSFISGTVYEYPYLIGKVVGEVSSHQVFSQDVSQPLLKKYPVEFMSLDSLPEIVSNAISTSIQYTFKSEYNSDYLLSQEELEQVSKLFEEVDYKQMDITNDELQFYYSLGMVNGYAYDET